MRELTTFVFASICVASSLAAAIKPTTPKLPVPESEQLDWAQYSPYFPHAQYKAPPSGCDITQVNILQRHGARFPTSGASKSIEAALAKLQNVTQFSDPKLDFVKAFVYDLGHDDLVEFGAEQSFDAGQEAFVRYSNLFNTSNIPFVRSDSSSRVVASANNWTAGFIAATKNKLTPKLNTILDADNNGNDTLEDGSCPNAGDSDNQTAAWESVYAQPIADQLNKAAPGANLTSFDVFNLISLCPFVSIFKFEKSPWCNLFEGFPEALPGFGYDGDLNKFYGTGYGQPLGRIQGVGYVNELLARLTETPVMDATQTNTTLDSSLATFPLNRTMYADFSHDDEISAIVSALGLFKQPQPMSTSKPAPNRTWIASTIVPFSGRIVFERLSCSVKTNGTQTTQTKVRVLAQDKIQPMPFCNSDKDGLCALDAFVASQSYARNNGEGDFEKCFANVTAPSS